MPFDVPPWTLDVVRCPEGRAPRDAARPPWRAGAGGMELRTIDGPRTGGVQLRLVSIRLPGARALTVGELDAACADAYGLLARTLLESEARHPVRLWNFIPHILEPLGDLRHRYMAFNAGRFRALASQLGGLAGIDRRVATASGVGHRGEDLSIHCLASTRDGHPVENPRQVPSYRYSERWGPKPPCFARATRCALEPADQGATLLVGGTASVVGEDSRHRGSLERQLEETLHNLATLVHVGVLNGHRHPDAPLPAGDALEPLLARYRSLRVYHVRAADREPLERILRDRVGSEVELEMLHADLCRPELLVEIEGVADLVRTVESPAPPRGLTDWSGGPATQLGDGDTTS